MDDTRYVRPGFTTITFRLSDSLRGFFSIFYSRRFRMNQCQSLTVWKRLVRRMYSYHVVDSTYCFVPNSIELSSKVETGHAINSEYLEELA